MADRFIVCCYGLVFDDGRILLVKHNRSHWGNGWALPGGLLRSGEGFQNCIERMVEKETSCSVKAIRQVISTMSYQDGALFNKHMILIFYLCKYLCGEPKAGEAVDAAIWANEELFTGLARDMDLSYPFIDAVSTLCINVNSFPELSFDFTRPESILRGMIID